jgi:nitrite reductase/ring-hydroxylating ferredoxin subunit
MNTETLCHIDDIAEGQSRGFVLTNKETVFAVKKDGCLFVYKNRCPHLGIELEWQEDQFLDNEGALIQCSTHGALFLIESGECISGPCVGKALQNIPYCIIDNKIVISR